MDAPMTPFKARPTEYRGVTMRSRLEAGFAQWLDSMRWDWEYEPKCFGGTSGQWLPDFVVDCACITAPGSPERRPVYIEVKPTIIPAAELATVRARMASVYDSDPNCAAVLVKEGTAPHVVDADGGFTPLDWTWTGLWPIDARRVTGPWSGEWWKGIAS